MPTTPKQTITIPFGGGLKQGQSSKQVDPPSVLRCQDYTIERDGRYTKLEGIEVRSLPSDGKASSESTILSNRGQLACITTDGLYAYRPEANDWTRRQTASHYPIEAIVDRLAVMGRKAVNPDIASNEDGVLCVVWEETGADVVYSLFLDEDGNILSGPDRVNTAITNQYVPRVIAYGGIFLVAWLDADPRSGSGNLYTQSYTWANQDYTWSSQQSQSATCNRFDLSVADVDETTAYLAHSVGGSVGVRRLPTTMIAADTTSFTFAGGNIAVHHDDDSSRVFVGYLASGTSDSTLKTFSLDLATTHATTTLLAHGSKPTWWSNNRAFIQKWSSSEWALVTSNDGGTDEPGIYVSTFDSAGNNVRSHEILDVYLHSRGVWQDLYDRTGKSGCIFGVHTFSQYMGTATPAQVGKSQYPAAMLFQWSSDDASDPAGNDTPVFLSRYARNPSNGTEMDWLCHLNSIVPMSSGNLAHVFTRVVNDPDVDTDDEVTRIDFAEFDLSSLNLPTVSANGATLIGGGHVGFYDRFSCVENSFLSPPEIRQIDNFTLVAGPPSSGTWDNPAIDVTLIARWVDSLGRVHRSPPSRPYTVQFSVAADVENLVSIAFDIEWMPALTNHNGDNDIKPVYELYMSGIYDYGSAIPTDRIPLGGNRYFREIIINPSRSVTLDNVFEHSTDTYSLPGDLSVQEYVQAGELASDPTEAARHMAASADRVFFLSGDGTYVGYSKPMNAPLYSVEFNESLELSVPGEGRESTGLAVLDDKLIVFKNDAIYVTSVGGGPDATGAGGSFPSLRPVPTDSGCTNRRSIVTTPVGVLFQGRRGIYLIDRNLSVSFVGSDIEDYLTSDVLSAVLDATRGEVCFGIRNEYSYGIIFNYEKQAWYTVGSREWLDGDSMTVIDGVWHGLKVGTRVVKRTPGAWFERDIAGATSANSVQPVLETAWIKLGGLQGFKRVVRATILGTHYSGDLRVRVAYDYNDTWVDTFSWAEADLSEMMQVRTPVLSRHKIQSVKFEISEVDSGTDDRGFDLEGLELEVIGKPGVSYRRIQSQTGA